MNYIDISPVLSERIAVWPGDVSFSRSVALSIAKGANLDLSSIRTTLHVGAHADAPSHYAADGASIEERDLSPYLGRCQVVRVDVARGARIRKADIEVPIEAPRVLFATGSFPDPEQFNEDFCSFDPDLIDTLASQGVCLVGIDTPSVDPFDDKELRAHQALYRHDLANLEGIVLDGVQPGFYELIALPLRIEGADAAPVRALLRPLS